MRFGIYQFLEIPRPWGDDAEATSVANALEQIELADRLGFHSAWAVEHHFTEEYSHLSAPEVFLAAAAARTHQIRIGHGVVITSPAFNHPFRTAERVAMLDLVSGGRVEFGSGESSSVVELGGFGVDEAVKREQWEEGLRVAVRSLTETPFTGHQGKYVHVPPRNVVPKPMQKPHPPLWLACSRHETVQLAAHLGMGVLSFGFIDPERAQENVRAYETTLATECVPIGESVNHQFACVLPMLCHPCERTALERGIEGPNFFGYALSHYYLFGSHQPGTTDVWSEFVAKRDEAGFSPSASTPHGGRLALRSEAFGLAGMRGAIGTPEQIRRFLRRYEAAGIDQILFLMQTGSTEHAHVLESLELFAREVMPEFSERDESRATGKRRRLAPVVNIALAKRDSLPPSPALPEDFRVEASG